MKKKSYMICPHCKNEGQSKVSSTYHIKSTNTRRRKRICNSCKSTFSTIEIPEIVLNTLRDKVELADSFLEVAIGHPKLLEVLKNETDNFKKEKVVFKVKKRKRRRPRAPIIT